MTGLWIVAAILPARMPLIMRSSIDIAMKCARVSVLGVLTVASVTGCSSKEPEVEVWVQPPQVHWADLLPPAVAPTYSGYRILDPSPTQGLFPASVGVTRVAIRQENDTTDGVTNRFRQILRDPRNEFLRWNSAFDDQMAISEVFPVDQRDLGGAEADPPLVIAALDALHARLGFIYAVNELAEDETEMFGALLDVQAGKPLAVVHAHAVSIPPPEDDGKGEPVDLWKSDSRALVRAEFESHVYQCVRELIARDEPAGVESPDGWTPLGPIRPVEWPPRKHRSGW